MSLMKDLAKLCTPAQIYVIMSLVSIVGLGFLTVYPGVVVVKVLYALLWTIILNSLCKAGYKKLSWFLVVLPFILFFAALVLFTLFYKDMIYYKHPTNLVIENMEHKDNDNDEEID